MVGQIELPIGEADVDIVRKLISTVQPHQIYVAGDLADPHGTHRQYGMPSSPPSTLEKEAKAAWLKDCRVDVPRRMGGMEIENIEMCALSVRKSACEAQFHPQAPEPDGERSVPSATTNGSSGSVPRTATAAPPGSTTTSGWPAMKRWRRLSNTSFNNLPAKDNPCTEESSHPLHRAVTGRCSRD